MITCKKCGSTVHSDQKYCPTCNCPVESDVNVEGINVDDEYKIENEHDKKAALKGAIIAGISTVLLVTVIVVFFVVKIARGDVLTEEEYLAEAQAEADEGDFDEAIELIGEGVEEYPESEDLLAKLDEYKVLKVEADVAGIILQAESEKDAENSIAIIQEGLEKYPDSAELKAELTEYHTALGESLVQSVLAEAEEYIESGDIASAVDVLEEAIEANGTEERYTEALETYISDYEESVLDEAEEAVEGEDYDEAIEVLNSALEVLGGENEAFEDAIAEYTKEKNESIVSDAISSAQDKAGVADYYGAYSDIVAAAEKIGDNEELENLAATYEASYVAEVCASVYALCGMSDYDAAKETMNIAIELFPDNAELVECKTMLDEHRSVALDTVSAINGGFTWNDGDATDIFGNSYADASNYSIIHGHNTESKFSSEYRVNGEYDTIRFTVAPYADHNETNDAYVQVFADEVLCYTSERIEQKTSPQNISVDISGAEYIEIVVTTHYYGCVIISEAMLDSVPPDNETVATYTPVNVLSPFGGKTFTWHNEYPADAFGTDYSRCRNYSVIHNHNLRARTTSAEYYLQPGHGYASLGMSVAPSAHFSPDDNVFVKVYVDEQLVYTSPEITAKTAKFGIEGIPVAGASFVRIDVEASYENACVILADVVLTHSVG